MRPENRRFVERVYEACMLAIEGGGATYWSRIPGEDMEAKQAHAKALSLLCASQAVVETGWGRSPVYTRHAAESRNLFGIKPVGNQLRVAAHPEIRVFATEEAGVAAWLTLMLYSEAANSKGVSYAAARRVWQEKAAGEDAWSAILAFARQMLETYCEGNPGYWAVLEPVLRQVAATIEAGAIRDEG